jgi:hypothetical protein
MAFAHLVICDACNKEAPLYAAYPMIDASEFCPNDPDAWEGLACDPDDGKIVADSGWIEDVVKGREFCSLSCWESKYCY